MQSFRFVTPQMPAAVGELRQQVREFLDVELAPMTSLAKARSWTGFDAEFSRKLGARGWTRSFATSAESSAASRSLA